MPKIAIRCTNHHTSLLWFHEDYTSIISHHYIILWMEEILHHLAWLKPHWFISNNGINHLSAGAGFLPPYVHYRILNVLEDCTQTLSHHYIICPQWNGPPLRNPNGWWFHHISPINFPPLDASRQSPRHGSAPRGWPGGETEVTERRKRWELTTKHRAFSVLKQQT